MTTAQKERITSCRTRTLSFDSGGGCPADVAIAVAEGVGGSSSMLEFMAKGA